jgi:4'-phosphopantetheinyl transferase
MNLARQRKLHYLTQRQHDLPSHERWLTRQEAVVLAGHKFPKRRRDWLLGRWTAKSALARFLPAADRPMTDWQILADSDGAPMVLENGQATGIPISLSHSGNRAMCALAGEPMRIGCDLETVEARSRSFEETFFTDGELKLIGRHPPGDRARLVTLVWSAKESALKALRVGLRADTRQVELKSFSSSQDDNWAVIVVEDHRSGGQFHGLWRENNGMVLTLMSDQPISRAIEL